MHKNLAIATRFYDLAEGGLERLTSWVDAALHVVPPSNIFVAIRIEDDLAGSVYFMRKEYPDVHTFPVTPWGKVVQAPNALLMKAAEHEMSHLLFASTEYPPTELLVARLESHFDPQTLVVGARLPTHDFNTPLGQSQVLEHASGMQIPWNTYALWSIEHLVHTGFVLAADSLHDPDNAGMEEMGTIAAQQVLWPQNAVAKLVTPHEGELVQNSYGWNVKRKERYVRNLGFRLSGLCRDRMQDGRTTLS